MADQAVTHADSQAQARMAAEIGRAMIRNDELIDRVLIRNWLLWGFGWLMLAPTIGVIVSTSSTTRNSSAPTPGRPLAGCARSTSTA
jgi:hypothetical protein